MSSRAAITVNRPPDEVRRLWDSPHEATFTSAPGDRGTEIRVESDDAEVKDELRRFKARVETGVVPTATEPETAGV
jgi:hypothetical protein